jgi:hypothetical protein
MSSAPGLCMARAYRSARSTGTSRAASAGEISVAPAGALRALASAASNSASAPGRATVTTPRGRSSGAAANPGGGSARKSRLAAVSARTSGGPKYSE